MTPRISRTLVSRTFGLFAAGLVLSRLWPSGGPGSATKGAIERPGALKRAPFALILATLRRAMDARLLPLAAEVAFFSLLSLVPALSILVLVYGLILDRTGLWDHIAPFVALLPTMAQDIVRDQTSRLISTPKADLSFNLLLSAVLATWSANAATKSLFEAVNLLFGERETRSILRLNLLTLAMTTGGVAFLVAALVLLGGIPALRSVLPQGAMLEWLLPWLPYPVVLLACVAGITLMYHIALVRPLGWRAALPGALLGALVWTLLSLAFGWYATGLGNYAASYGSLAAIIVLMTWLWLSVAAVLLGAAYNAERCRSGE